MNESTCPPFLLPPGSSARRCFWSALRFQTGSLFLFLFLSSFHPARSFHRFGSPCVLSLAWRPAFLFPSTDCLSARPFSGAWTSWNFVVRMIESEYGPRGETGRETEVAWAERVNVAELRLPTSFAGVLGFGAWICLR